MKKAIVFGGAGFVGSRLCPILEKQYDLTIVDTFWFWEDKNQYIEKVGIENAKVVVEDTRSNDIEKLMRGKDIVINLSCLSNDTSSDVDYKFTHDVSYNGVMNVFNKAFKKKVGKLIQTSTTSVYGIKQGKMVTEEEVPEPITQYSSIKAELDNVLKYHMKYSDTGITILRPATLYGYSPRLRLDVMVNTLLDRTFRDKKMMIEGGEQLRPCLHVDDLCNAYIQSIENPISNGKIYNVTNENYSVNQIVSLIKSVVPEVELHYQHVIDQRSYKTSSALVKKELGLKFKKKLNKSTIKELYNHIQHSYYDKFGSINMRVIKKLLSEGLT
jgi:nucleoside-diphosphate-sugar epimerase